MKFVTTLFLFLACTQFASAQVSNSTGSIIIERGATLVVAGALANESGTININGRAEIGGDFVNSGTLSTFGDESRLVFTGNNAASFSTSDATVSHLELRKSGAHLFLDGSLSIQDSLTLSNAANARIVLAGDNLELEEGAVITGAGTNEYIELSGAGKLSRFTTTAGEYDFPVGNTNGLTLLTADVSGDLGAQSKLTVGVNPVAAPDLPAEAEDFINRHWTVTSEGITNYANTVSATYLPGEVTGQEADLLGASFSEGEWTSQNGARNERTLSATITDPMAIFSGFSARFLPVELLEFTARYMGKDGTELGWVTTDEVGAEGFHVERSADGQTWANIGFVAATGERGRTTRYSFADERVRESLPAADGAVYRLKMTDLDGSFEYSPLRYVSFTDFDANLAVYPNPARDLVAIDAPEEVLTVEVIDANGRRVLSATNRQIDVSALPQGAYQLLVTTVAGQGTARLLKN